MKQFFKILALAALALPFTGCDVEYSDINILPDPVFEQNGLPIRPAFPTRRRRSVRR